MVSERMLMYEVWFKPTLADGRVTKILVSIDAPDEFTAIVLAARAVNRDPLTYKFVRIVGESKKEER